MERSRPGPRTLEARPRYRAMVREPGVVPFCRRLKMTGHLCLGGAYPRLLYLNALPFASSTGYLRSLSSNFSRMAFWKSTSNLSPSLKT